MDPFRALLGSCSRPQPRGFTLVEMLVVLAIVTLVTTVALVSQSSFNRSLLLTNTAYTIALSVRQAQSLGLSSRQFVGGGSPVRNAGYGIYIARPSPPALATSYVVFADIDSPPSGSLANCPRGPVGTPEEKPGNCRYVAGTDGLLQTYKLDRGFVVSRFCGREIAAGSPLRCSDDSSNPLTELHVVYRRPNTETVARGVRGSSNIQISSAALYVSTPDLSATRGICITSVGQVSVTEGTCAI